MPDNLHISPELLSNYADGELDRQSAAAVESHLRECGDCSSRLADLRALAMRIAGINPDFSPIAMARLRHRMQLVMQERFIRTAWTLSGLAASVLLVGSFWLTHLTDAPAAAPPWVGASIASDSASREVNSNPAAVWYLSSATGRDELP